MTLKLLNLIFIGLISSSVCLAGKDGISGGGLIGPRGNLLDFEEAVYGGGLVPFVPRQEPIFKSEVTPILDRVHLANKAFANLLHANLTNGKKQWYFTNESLEGSVNTDDLHVLIDDKTLEVIAKQNSTSIVVYKPWYDRKKAGDYIEKMDAGGLFIHEAIMGVAMDNKIPHDNVRKISRVLYANELGGEFPTRGLFNILKAEGFYPALRPAMQKQAQDLLPKLVLFKQLIEERHFGVIDGRPASKTAKKLTNELENISRCGFYRPLTCGWENELVDKLTVFTFQFQTNPEKRKFSEALAEADELIKYLSTFPDNE